MHRPKTILDRDFWARKRHSLRTRYSLATGFFLLVILAVFYIGGRIVLVHLVKDAEQQVREIGKDINRIALRNADCIKRLVEGLPSDRQTGRLEDILGHHGGLDIALALRLTSDGSFGEGILAGPSGPRPMDAADIAGYADQFQAWARQFGEDAGGMAAAPATSRISSGIVHVCGVSVNCAIAPCPDGRFLVLGTAFNSDAFTAEVNESFAGMEVKVTNRRTPVSATPVVVKRMSMRPSAPAPRKPSFGLAPLVSEAIDFYSGGFWKLGDNPFEAVYTIRDIAGNPISTIAVSLPKTFSNAAGVAIGRLTLFVSLVGIVLVLPIFWFQSCMLLNPLSKMTECVRNAREHCGEADCPRLEWRGADEFAELAFSVNSLLESITSRTLAIAQVESRQKALIGGLPDGLMVFDREHRLVTVIKQLDDLPPIPGFVEKAPIDVTVYGRDGVDLFGTAVDAVFVSNKMQMIHLQGGERPHTRYFDLRISPMDEMFVLVIARDITEIVLDRNRRRAAENRLQHVHKQRSLAIFAGSIAHDVNNILAAVLNTVEIAFLDAKTPELQEAMNTIRDAVRRGSAMTRELMTFAGETKYAFRRCEMAALIRDTRSLVDGVTGDGVSVRYDVPDDLPAVDADPDQFWKVIFNLVKNAGESMEGMGEVRVTARRYEMTDDIAVFFFSSKTLPAGPGVLITIADDGPGIPKDMLRRIFDPYVSSKSTGRGFGLATVNSIVDAHHGGIRVESQLGHGTTFGVFLPISKIAVVRALPRREDAPKPVPVADAAPRRHEILLVDDDAAILTTTSILLKTLSYTVHVAREADEATALFRRHSRALSCVIMDAHLAASDSVRLLATFRATNPAVPVIVSSGSAPEVAKELFASQPFDAFLAKPYTLADLKAILGGVG